MPDSATPAFGRVGGTRTHKPFGTGFLDQRVYHFHHDPIFALQKSNFRLKLLNALSIFYHFLLNAFSILSGISRRFVLSVGIEPTNLSAYVPKTYVSANSTTKGLDL
jgi:hypothetical protein